MQHHPRGFAAGGILQSLGVAIVGIVVLASLSFASEAFPDLAPEEHAEESFDEPRPDPRECSDAQRQVRDLVREARRLEKLLVKAKRTDDAAALREFMAQAEQHGRTIKADCTRDVLQEFWDAQLWDAINAVRCKAELPQQIAQIERELKRLGAQATQKRIALSGLDAAQLGTNIAVVKQAVADAQSALAGGTCEDANDAMQVIWDGMHPGEIMGVITRLSDIGGQLKRVKDGAIRQEFVDAIQPILDAANAGDFREANMVLNDIFNQLQQLLFKVINRRQYRYAPTLEKLEALLQDKLGSPERIPDEFLNAPPAAAPARPAPAAESAPAPATPPADATQPVPAAPAPAAAPPSSAGVF